MTDFKRSPQGQALHDRLRYHVSGAIERGEGVAVAQQVAPAPSADDLVDLYLVPNYKEQPNVS